MKPFRRFDVRDVSRVLDALALVGALALAGCSSGAHGGSNAMPGGTGGVGGGRGTGNPGSAGAGDPAPLDAAPAGSSGSPLPGIDAAAAASDGPAPEAPSLDTASSDALAATPLLAVLDQFAAPDVPTRGPAEGPPVPHYWVLPTVMPALPGGGLGQHPMLYAGEGLNTVFVINHGQVVWSYAPAGGGEIDDVWMLSNGHVLIAFEHQVLEVSPKKELVWHYDVPGAAQVHTCQPIGLDRVLFVQNDLPPRVMIINKKTGATELNQPLMAPDNADPGPIHTQFRRFRLTGAGTYLASFLELGKVVEYDKTFKPIWSYAIASPWSAIRLRSGNTLITAESSRTIREVSPTGEKLWEFTQSDLPAGVIQQNTQSADRLSSGNTVIFSSRSPKDASKPNIQAIEVSSDKKAVWILQDWKNLGPATTAQFLDEPGIPETPGELQH